MSYDYQLAGGTLLVVFALVAVINAIVEHRSPLLGLIGLALGGGLIVWAWVLSEQELRAQDVPLAYYRLIGRWF